MGSQSIKNSGKIYLLDHTPEELAEFFTGIGEKRYRGKQVFEWIYKKYASDFSSMSDIPKTLRQKLDQTAEVSRLFLKDEQSSQRSGTRKFLYELHDSNCIETVFMPGESRNTICISSQAGCAFKCSFCATGLIGFKRNLSVGEMTEQILSVVRLTGVKPTNVVFMGMGEPFHNYENTLKAAYIINDKNGIRIGARHITISTIGLTDKILRYYNEGHNFKLAISLNAGTNKTRQSIMPVAGKHPIEELGRIIMANHKRKSHPVTLEYVLLRGINDTEKEISSLIKFAGSLPVKINLIPYNAASSEYSRPKDDRVEAIFQKIHTAGIQVTIRRSMGADIQAACGQLYGRSSTQK